MPLQVYPATPKPSFSYTLDHQLKTMVIDFETGNEQRNRRRRFSLRTFIIGYKVMGFTASERDAISDFYYQRYGSYETFWYFDFQERKWVDEYIGRGDGSTRVFDMPGSGTATTKSLSAILTEDGNKITTEAGDLIVEDTVYDSLPTVYINGSAVTNFGINVGEGEGGADEIDFGIYTPSAGTLITCDFTGYLRIKGRFKDDRLTEEIITKDLANLAVSIYEVRD